MDTSINKLGYFNLHVTFAAEGKNVMVTGSLIVFRVISTLCRYKSGPRISYFTGTVYSRDCHLKFAEEH